MALENKNVERSSRPLDLYFVSIDEACQEEIFRIVNAIRSKIKRISVDMGSKVSKMKKEMKIANQLNARYVAIYGIDEMEQDKIKLKNMETGDEQLINFTGFGEELERILVEKVLPERRRQ